MTDSSAAVWKLTSPKGSDHVDEFWRSHLKEVTFRPWWKNLPRQNPFAWKGPKMLYILFLFFSFILSFLFILFSFFHSFLLSLFLFFFLSLFLSFILSFFPYILFIFLIFVEKLYSLSLLTVLLISLRETFSKVSSTGSSSGSAKRWGLGLSRRWSEE